jgi:hypothetical protein
MDLSAEFHRNDAEYRSLSQRGGCQIRLKKRGDEDMKRVALAGVTALAVIASSEAIAQTVIELRPSSAPGSRNTW